MILPVALLHLHLAAAPLPMADPRLTEKETQRFYQDEDALNTVRQQWQGRRYEPDTRK